MTPRPRACTAITLSHLPWARALAVSFAARHPEGELLVLVVDRRGRPAGDLPGVVALLEPADVGLDDAELRLRAALYGPQELAGSTRALLLAHALDRSAGAPVLFLDADVLVCGPLDPLLARTAASGIALTPHLHAAPPVPTAAERAFLLAGAFNAGVVGVAGDAGRRLADWWAGHLARDCLLDAPGGLSLSQRWLDLAPAYFDVDVVRDAGVNVTPWNAAGREAIRDAGGWRIDGEPLVLLHPGGDFDPHGDAWPRMPGLTEVLRTYAALLQRSGIDAPPAAYGWAEAADGTPLTPWLRRGFRSAVLAGGQPPDPFDPAQTTAFRSWWAEPVGPRAVPRHLDALRAWRADLGVVYSDAAFDPALGLARWAAEHPGHDPFA